MSSLEQSKITLPRKPKQTISGVLQTQQHVYPDPQLTVHSSFAISPLPTTQSAPRRKACVCLGIISLIVYRRPFPGPLAATRWPAAQSNTALSKISAPLLHLVCRLSHAVCPWAKGPVAHRAPGAGPRVR
ncbi:hypothetical protein PSPO01_05149 [Paraphaeosphaeria sporulosa]